MQVDTEREKVRFVSGDGDCAGWHYQGDNGACVVMAGGFAVTKEPGTDKFARQFHEAGFSVLAFDYRRLGESSGSPRQVVRVADQLTDWEAALSHAATLPGVDPARIAAWGFSVSGGLLIQVAARSSGTSTGGPALAAVIAQTPNADGLAALRNARRHTTSRALGRLTARGVADTVRGLFGRDPLLVPLVGRPGTVAVLSTPDAVAAGDRALNPDHRYPEWQQTVAARSVLSMPAYRPGRYASQVPCPLLVLVCDQDQSSLAAPAVRAAAAAPRGELARLPGGHYAPFLDGHEQAVELELSFLRRHLLPDRPPAAP